MAGGGGADAGPAPDAGGDATGAEAATPASWLAPTRRPSGHGVRGPDLRYEDCARAGRTVAECHPAGSFDFPSPLARPPRAPARPRARARWAACASRSRSTACSRRAVSPTPAAGAPSPAPAPAAPARARSSARRRRHRDLPDALTACNPALAAPRRLERGGRASPERRRYQAEVQFEVATNRKPIPPTLARRACAPGHWAAGDRPVGPDGCGRRRAAKPVRHGAAPQAPVLRRESEACANLFREELRLFPGREVPALVELVVVDQLGIRALCPAPRGLDRARRERRSRRPGSVTFLGRRRRACSPSTAAPKRSPCSSASTA